MPVRKTITALLFSTALQVAPTALAQSQEPPPLAAAAPEAAEDESTPETDTGALHLPGYGSPTNRSWLEFEIAPELVSHNPLGSASRTSDATNVSLTFITTHPLSRSLEFEFDAGPSTMIDTDKDAPFESALAAGLELRTRTAPSGFASFVSYGVARDYADFFGRGLETSQTLKAGVRYGGKFGPMTVGFELAPRWVNASHDLNDYLAGELWMEGVIQVFDEGIKFIAEGVVDRRWYQDLDPSIQGKRRDWRLEAFLGLDFADAVSRRDDGLLRSLGVGVRWIDVHSNLDSADRSSLKFLPTVTLRLGL